MASSSGVPADTARAARGRVGWHIRVAFALLGACSVLYATTNHAFATPGLPRRRSVAEGSVVARHALQSLDKPKLANTWRLNVGHAIDVLRTDLVAFFDSRRPLPHTPDLSIFSEDVVIVDARLPSFQLRGLATYQQILSTLQWSLRTACTQSELQITAISPPINSEVYIRWRLKLVPKDMFASAKGLLGPLGTYDVGYASGFPGMPFTVEGYSRYEFDSWSGAIVKHTIDITNPPMYIMDIFSQYAQVPSWLSPAPNSLGVPHMMQEASLPLTGNSARKAVAPAYATVGHGEASRGAREGVGAASAGNWMPFLPQSCEDDYECNDGKANFPLQCCELPLLGSFCCEPDDYRPAPQGPAYVPLPVPNEEPWEQQQV